MPVHLIVQLDFRVFTEQDAAQALVRLAAAGLRAMDPSIYAAHLRSMEATLHERGDLRTYEWGSDAQVITTWIAVEVDAETDDEDASDVAVDSAVAKLDSTISPIERDPTVQWQIGRMDSIVRLD